jgi:dimethylargininase
MNGFFAYTHALVRTPGRSVVDGLRKGDGPSPDYEALLEEHRLYVATLRDLGLEVSTLAPSEAHPDALFVEDPALVFGEGAIVLRLAAPTRAGEGALIVPELERRFSKVLRMTGPGYVDGGDVLVLPDRVVIGLSRRTDRAGAEELASLLAEYGRKSEISETPEGGLHFKTGCSLIDEETIFAIPEKAEHKVFSGMRFVSTPPDEAGAANILRIRDTILIGEQFVRSREVIEAHGFATRALPVAQIKRIDAGLSCMSLRWRALG